MHLSFKPVPGWSNAGPDCVCICPSSAAGITSIKIGTNVKSAFKGISHGVVDFAIGSIHDLHTALAYMGTEQQEMASQERVEMIETIEQSQEARMNAVGDWMMDRLSVDQSDALYQSFRSKTTTGLEIGSLVTGGYGAVKGVIGFSRLARMPVQIAKLSAKGSQSVKGVLKVGKFTYSDTATKHLTELVKKGPNASRLSRPYMKSQLTINEIMAAGNPISDPGGIPGGLRWDIPGTFRGSVGTWELVLHPETEIIYHFNFK